VGEDIGTLSEQPPRKLRRVDLTERSTLRGLTTGIVRLRSDEALLPCVVFGGGFSSRLPVLRELGYQAILVHSPGIELGTFAWKADIRDEKHLEAVEDLVEDKCAVWCGPDWGVFGVAMPSFGLTRNMMGFVDGRVTDGLRRMSEGMGVQTLVGTKGARRTFPGWHVACQRIEHSAVGEVTSGVVILTAMTRRLDTLAGRGLPFVVARDASTVLSVHPL
jgi:hypothetical protein